MCHRPVPLDGPKPLQPGVSNALGFTRGCSRVPCPVFPFPKVRICMQLPRGACVTIQTGCMQPSLDPDQPFVVVYTPAATQDTYGLPRRMISFRRAVPNDTYIRIRVCACEPCEEACIDGETAKLLSFDVDGTDLVEYLNGVLHTEAHAIGSVFVGCMGASDGCCNDDTFTSLDSIPVGAEIRVGPIGASWHPVLLA